MGATPTFFMILIAHRSEASDAGELARLIVAELAAGRLSRRSPNAVRRHVVEHLAGAIDGRALITFASVKGQWLREIEAVRAGPTLASETTVRLSAAAICEWSDLPDRTFRAAVELLSLSAESGGRLPVRATLAAMTDAADIADLIAVGLIADEGPTGCRIVGWSRFAVASPGPSPDRHSLATVAGAGEGRR